MAVRFVFTVAEAVLTGPTAAGGIGTGEGRTGAVVAGVAALIGIAIGGLALARATRRTGNVRTGAIAAGIASLTGLVIGGLHLADSTGGFGTGNGRAGAIVAIALSLVGMALAGLALTRSRQAA
ncbi:DUF6223 family protein [Actinomadura sp. KC345]|uniref:DUF6223 family protein n=1 Tax=Actinomadura sp. KC345 TaxID=2530371 RepID=UPI001A9DC1C0|nr:DUF6223 family protein [Actinomadura sp. KC345]